MGVNVCTRWNNYFVCRRWLRVFEGELLYYKPDDLEVMNQYITSQIDAFSYVPYIIRMFLRML